MNHYEIRFNILYLLYQKHYSNELGHLQMTDNILADQIFSGMQREVLYGDVVYLVESGLIKGEYMLGRASPFAINITNHGIDVVDNIVNSSIENIRSISKDEGSNVITEIENEPNPVTKIKAVVEFAKLHSDLWLNILKIARETFMS